MASVFLRAHWEHQRPHTDTTHVTKSPRSSYFVYVSITARRESPSSVDVMPHYSGMDRRSSREGLGRIGIRERTC